MLRLMGRALGDSLPGEELARLRRQAYLHMGRNLVEFMRLRALSPDEVDALVRLEGEEHLRRALAAGQGVIILTAHFGNWELLGARLAQVCGRGKFHVVAQPQRDERLTRLLDSVRQPHGVTVISRGAAAREVLRALRRGEAVGILLDVDMKESGILVDFLGRPASTAAGPAVFALRTGAAVVPVFALRQPDGSHIGRILKPVEIIKRGDAESDIEENTARFSEIIGDWVRAYPEQWIWLPDRWRSAAGAEGRPGRS
jgi:KDO2-lipid IV(A) lauroyltransferase